MNFEWQVIHFLLNLWSRREPLIVLSQDNDMTDLGSEMIHQTTVNDGEEKGESERGC